MQNRFCTPECSETAQNKSRVFSHSDGAGDGTHRRFLISSFSSRIQSNAPMRPISVNYINTMHIMMAPEWRRVQHAIHLLLWSKRWRSDESSGSNQKIILTAMEIYLYVGWRVVHLNLAPNLFCDLQRWLSFIFISQKHSVYMRSQTRQHAGASKQPSHILFMRFAHTPLSFQITCFYLIIFAFLQTKS